MKRQAFVTLILFAAGWTWFSVMAVVGSSDGEAMTVGCAEASCCTSRCYLDENGVHHCVPKDGTSCSCGVSSQDRDSVMLPALEPGTLTTFDRIHVETSTGGDIHGNSIAFPQTYLVIPTPPPRSPRPV